VISGGIRIGLIIGNLIIGRREKMWLNAIKRRMKRKKRLKLKSTLIRKQSQIVRNKAILQELRAPGFVFSQANEIGDLEQQNFLIEKEIEDIQADLKKLGY